LIKRLEEENQVNVYLTQEKIPKVLLHTWRTINSRLIKPLL